MESEHGTAVPHQTSSETTLEPGSGHPSIDRTSASLVTGPPALDPRGFRLTGAHPRVRSGSVVSATRRGDGITLETAEERLARMPAEASTVDLTRDQRSVVTLEVVPMPRKGGTQTSHP